MLKQPILIFLFLTQIIYSTESSLVYLPTTCTINQPMIYFVRHAESLFNKVNEQLQVKHGKEQCYDSQEYTEHKFSPEYLDVEITEEGAGQALGARQKMAGIDVDIILVSPMRRALHTCDIIFKDHHSKAPIIVEPAFRQIMESSNDIGSKIQESMQLYPHFNFEMIKDKEAWFVHTLSNQQDRQNILNNMKGLQGKERSQVAIGETMKIMKENWFERRKDLENEEKLKQRVLPNYNEQFKVLEGYYGKYSKIAVVAHSECIKFYAGYKIKNCEIFPLAKDKLPQK